MSKKSCEEPFRVAIIGGGMGGATAAYYLRQLFGSQVGLTLFEQTGRVGGRIRAVQFAGQQYETGASIFHTSNLYMCKFAKQFGLEIKDESKPDDRPLFYNGQGGLTFSTLGGPSMLVPLRLLWRYGTQFIRLRWYTGSMVKDFSRIYELQDENNGFTTPARLLEALRPEFLEMTKWTYSDWLSRRLKITADRLKDEIVYGLMSNNYCQNMADVHAFVGFISMASILPKLASIKGGNELVPQKLAQSALEINPSGSPREILHAQVTTVSPAHATEQFTVEYLPSGSNQIKRDTFDYVILATPLHQKANVRLDKCIVPPTATYQAVDHSFFLGTLRHSEFGIRSDSYSVRQFPAIFPTQNAYLSGHCLFRSLLSVSNDMADRQERMWVTFSDPARVPNPLQTLAERYVDRRGSNQAPSLNSLKVSWLAYPVYEPLNKPETQLGTFVLAPKLYYANAIERVASCMEIAAIGGRNVALLVYAHKQSTSRLTESEAMRALVDGVEVYQVPNVKAD
ncbi:prenylcysteine oxidase / farnesylcysteine lyase [Paragonimus westermani]|uniref:Prenylcysteine oxidase / farnesylcysteine lyase n=1 Tax=Paragonimus westermani TaxID=34504 RepID=A0A5J4P2V1_9TREM|nr:prenylcysteine oxidase / farnesylcysteine lyase [Paragonimus westermani]